MNFIQYMFADPGQSSRVAIAGSGETMTYQSLCSDVGAIQAYLQHGPYVHTQRVGLLGSNSPFLIAAYLGIVASGKTAVPLNPTWDVSKLTEIVSSCEIQLMFVDSRLLKKFASLLSLLQMCVVEQSTPMVKLEKNHTAFVDLLTDYSDGSFAPVSNPDELAVIIFTSGSSGRPKGVMLSHSNLVANTRSILGYLDLRDSDCGMLVLPLYYCYGASVIHTHLTMGASLRLNNQFMFTEKFLDDLEAQECTGFSGVPAHFYSLLRRSTFSQRKLSSLRYMTCAGGKFLTTYVKELRKVKPDVKLYLMYGQTEATSRLSYLPPDLVDEKSDSIGKGIPGVMLKVVRENNTSASLGEMGEVVARGENIAMGYWKDVDATADRIRDGWLYTGDIAVVDADGYIYIIDRVGEFLKSFGHRVSPSEIEDVIAGMPMVLECAVVQANDPELGECLGAYVVPRIDSQLMGEDVIRHCSKNLPSYKVPVPIVVVENLPKGESGKIIRRNLATL